MILERRVPDFFDDTPIDRSIMLSAVDGTRRRASRTWCVEARNDSTSNLESWSANWALVDSRSCHRGYTHIPRLAHAKSMLVSSRLMDAVAELCRCQTATAAWLSVHHSTLLFCTVGSVNSAMSKAASSTQVDDNSLSARSRSSWCCWKRSGIFHEKCSARVKPPTPPCPEPSVQSVTSATPSNCVPNGVYFVSVSKNCSSRRRLYLASVLSRTRSWSCEAACQHRRTAGR